MPRTEGNYSVLFERIEQEFSIEDTTAENLMEFFGVETSGRLGLAQQLAQASDIALDIESIEDISELRALRDDISKLLVHKQELNTLLDERLIAVSVTTTQEFAQARGLDLDEDTIGNIEVWKGVGQVITIRENGRFVGWKKV